MVWAEGRWFVEEMLTSANTTIFTDIKVSMSNANCRFTTALSKLFKGASKCDSFTYSLTFLLLLACKHHLKRLTRDLQEKTYVEKSKCVRALHNLGCLSTISFTTLTPGFVWMGGDPCRLTLTRPYNCPLSLWTFIFQPAADLGLSDTLRGSSSAVGRLFELWCVTLCRAQGQDFELVQKEMTDFKKSFRQCSKPLTIHCIVQYTVDMPFLSYASPG